MARVGAGNAALLATAVTVALAAAACGPPGARTQLWMLTAGVVAGLPHGALDVLTAEAWLKPRLRKRWLPVFIAAYLAAGALVVALWAIAPRLALTGFLLLAALHFGEALAPAGPKRPQRTVAHGLAPIVVPALAHSGAVASAFAALAGRAEAATLVAALSGPVALVWLIAVVVAVASRAPIVELAAVVLVFVALPPLAAFAVYFAGLHGPRAVAEIARTHGRSVGALLATAAPFVALGTGLIAVGYALSGGSPCGASPALVRALFVGLAALAVPHLLLGWIGAPALPLV